MIRIRTPLRISLFGGGSDYAQHFAAHGGAVLCTAINHYVHTTIQDGYLSQCCDLPTGCGLGSSAASAVGFAHMRRHLSNPAPMELAVEAIEAESRTHACGWQDQVIAAFGGFRWIRFERSGKIVVDPYPVTFADDGTPHGRAIGKAVAGRLAALDDRLLLFDTGIRRAGTVPAYDFDSPAMQLRLGRLRDMADRAAGIMLPKLDDEAGLDEIGHMLHQAWLEKRQLGGVTTDAIDGLYSRACEAGALGGKITGRGNGGMLLLFAPVERQADVRAALGELIEVPFRFEPRGSVVATDSVAG